MKSFYFLLSSLAVLITGMHTSFAQDNQNTEVLFDKIDNYLTEAVPNGFSGAMLVSKQGQILNKGYGLADKEQNTPNTSNTIFDIGSNTKQFTGAAILKLVEQNKLVLTNPLNLYFENLSEDKSNITIHQLLTHTSGLTESVGRDFDEISREAFFKKVFESELLHKPGTEYAYSNIGYSILARVIELASSQSYESFLNQHFFGPLGMDQTGYLMPNWISGNIARGYYRNVLDAGSMVGRYKDNNEVSWNLMGNGGINSTQTDMFRWIHALKNNEILTPSSTKTLMTPHIKMAKSKYSYGYGWVININDHGTKRISHNGSNSVFTHSIIWHPEEDLQIIYATNAHSPQIEWVAYEIEKMILAEEYVPKAIEKNVYYFIWDYTQKHPPKMANDLLNILNEDFDAEFNNRGVLNRMGNIILDSHIENQWAVELFRLNIQLYPDDGNLWDSLGYGYLATENKEDAINAFKKAVQLGYKDAEKKLKELLQE